MKTDTFIALLAAAGLGALIWVMSPAISGAVEPWDAESPYYFVSLFIAGVLGGVFVPRKIWAAYAGIVLGQLIYMVVFLEIGPLMVLGIAFLIGYGLVSLLGAFLGSRLKRIAGDSGASGDSDA